MSVLDIFKNDAFNVITMSDALSEVKYKPGFLTAIGLFETTSVDTTRIGIEKDKEENLIIVPESPRGGVGKTIGKKGRSMRYLDVPHFQVDDSIYAEEVQNVRAFGQEQAVETFQGRIANRAVEVKNSFALTEEWHKMSVVVNGQMLDADGSVIYDYFAEMGEAQPAAVDWDLDNANPDRGILRQRSTNLVRAMGDSLGGLPFSGILALCGDTFFDDLVKHKEVYDTYLGHPGASRLRQPVIDVSNQSLNTGVWGRIDLFDITWVNYRGMANGPQIPTNECKFIPLGVPGLFRSVYAPADYIETVNTMGKKLYVKTLPMHNDKGVSVEYQTNVLHYCTRPRLLMRAVRT